MADHHSLLLAVTCQVYANLLASAPQLVHSLFLSLPHMTEDVYKVDNYALTIRHCLPFLLLYVYVACFMLFAFADLFLFSLSTLSSAKPRTSAPSVSS